MLFFIILNSNPFSSINPIPKEGLGLNPILQDPALAIHPPLLYIGFVGSSIYFSAAMASMISNYSGRFFAQSIKSWVLISWTFQTLGILVGSIWAYYELGWGGFWFWDPVENASLLPWFAMTALLHSLLVLEKRNTLYFWTIILCLLTFTLSVTGTFLVRSGILNSVHTFDNDTSRCIYILIFLSLMIFASIYFLFSKYRPTNDLINSNSKETFVLINNWFMMFYLITVLLGTLYPIFTDAISNNKISVGPPFYNTVIIPVVIAFLFFMAIGPQTKWIKNKILLQKKIKQLPKKKFINGEVFKFLGTRSNTKLYQSIQSASMLTENVLLDDSNRTEVYLEFNSTGLVKELAFALYPRYHKSVNDYVEGEDYGGVSKEQRHTNTISQLKECSWMPDKWSDEIFRWENHHPTAVYAVAILTAQTEGFLSLIHI